MKVLLFTTHLDVGGIGIYTVNIARYLKKKGIDMAVCSEGGELEKKLSSDGIAHYKLGVRSKFEFGPKMWLSIAPFIRLVRDGKFDVIHAHTRVTQVISCLAERFTAVPVVTTCHGFYAHTRLGRRIFPAWGRKVIAISRRVEKHLLDDFKLPPGKVRQIYMGIEVARFTEAKKKKDPSFARGIGLRDGLLTIGAVGRFSAVKGHVFLIEAFERLAAKEKNIQLLLVGDKGKEKGKLLRLIRERSLEGKVFLLSGTRAWIEKYFALMDIFSFPSVDEGLGLSLIEAMAAGCAPVAANIGGVPELVEDGVSGLLVPSRDAEALAGAIGRLISDGALRERISRNASEKIARDFRIEASAEKFIEVYEEVLKGRICHEPNTRI